MDQPRAWERVNTIKRQVHEVVGDKLSYAFRSTQVYQTYTGLCGEAHYAYEDGELTEALVTMLEEQAQKVIELWQSGTVK